MRALLFVLVAACTPATQTITPAHPAHPDAEPGRLAGPPAALRPGVAEVTPPAPATQNEHAGHVMPSTPKPVTDDVQPATPGTQLPDNVKPPTPGTPLPADMQPPAEAKPAAKKPASRAKKTPAKPAKDPHEGHQQPAPDPHQGHQGH